MSLKGKWGYSTDEERYSGSFDTKEDAIQEARACEDKDGDFFVGQFEEIRISVCGDRVIDQAQEDAYEQAGEYAEDWLAKIPRERVDELTCQLSEVFDGWLKKYDLTPTFATVDSATIEHILVESI